MKKDSVGIVKTKYLEFFSPPHELKLESGEKLGPVHLAYETYGTLNRTKTNAVLVLHALSGDAHAAGYHRSTDKKPGWWDIMIGPGKAFDTHKYYVICSNVMGGCKGSTGPSSINPITKRTYGLSFPIITIKDMVKAQKALMDHLGIKKILTLVGGSMGGMQVLQWTVSYPDMCHSAIPIATAPYLSAQSIAFDEVGRQAIISDPYFKGGNYYKSRKKPSRGLAIARMIGHITYLSEKSMHSKFGRNLQDKAKYSYRFLTDFQVESYLHHQGDSFVKRFDANSYLYISKAMDYFDISQGFSSMNETFARVKAKYLVVSFSSDWLFPPAQSKRIVNALRQNLKFVSYVDVPSSYGHDAFLLESETLTRLIKKFLATVSKEIL
ncbi:MAG: homoserine O-acetyltransferase [Spirochaetes bacterium]|nr:homoserine O-acetyltransferase [Spirochaetota bacterium]